MEKAQDELNFGEGENWLCVMFSSQGPTSLPCGEKEGEGLALERAINIRGKMRQRGT